MPKNRRNKTRYPGVFWIESSTIIDGKAERIYYIQYRRGGKLIEEKAGRAGADFMTAAQANQIRAERIQGKAPSNADRREKVKRDAENTFDFLWKLYEETRNHASLRDDESRYRLHIKPAFGTRAPVDLGPLDVERFRGTLEKKGLSPQTVKHVLSLLNRLARFGVEVGAGPGLRFRLRLPRVDNEKTEDLPPDQITKFITFLDEYPERDPADMVSIALFTGLRKGTIERLRWEDVRYDRGVIYLRHVKGRDSTYIPMNGDAARVLRRRQGRKRKGLVFPLQQEGKYHQARKGLDRLKKAAGLPEDFRPLHSWRHVFSVSAVSQSGVSLYALQQLLGHTSPTMTQRYAKFRDEALKEVSEQIAKGLKKKKKGDGSGNRKNK